MNDEFWENKRILLATYQKLFTTFVIELKNLQPTCFLISQFHWCIIIVNVQNCFLETISFQSLQKQTFNFFFSHRYFAARGVNRTNFCIIEIVKEIETSNYKQASVINYSKVESVKSLFACKLGLWF